MKNMLHQSVLLDATVSNLNPQIGDRYLDLTAGLGGHARAILARTQNYHESVLVDRDKFALDQLGDLRDKGVKLWHSDFLAAAQQLIKQRREFEVILLDLGVSSPQLDMGERGFSFNKAARLDMRMDQSSAKDAFEVVNSYQQDDLYQIFVNYGEIKPKVARRVTQAIIKNRPIEMTTELAELICYNIPRRRGKIHPATQFFQALRIEVNDELQQLKAVLGILPQLLTTGGRVAIISFHSLEDRLVKQYFKQQVQLGLQAQLELITPRPILGSVEDVSNPRSRSAILRVVIKKQK